MAKGPEEHTLPAVKPGSSRSRGLARMRSEEDRREDYMAQLEAMSNHPSFRDSVQVVHNADGSRGLKLAFGGGLSQDRDREEVLSWAASNSRPDPGTPEDQLERREHLFERLRNIDAKTVIELAAEYFDVFPPHPGSDYMSADSLNAGGSIMSNLEGYIFDPDRVVAMCKALQDAVRQTAQNIEGPITVLEAGYGLGFVAMSALALNDELDDRVRVVGLEVNKAVAHRAAQLLDYYGILQSKNGERYVDLHPADASKVMFQNVVIHILVAEHLNTGVFCNEPLHAIHENIVPILSEPFFIIPEGLDIYGRVVKSNGHMDVDDVRDRVGIALDAREEKIDFRSIEFDEIEEMLKGVNDELIRERLLRRIKFSDVLTGEWDGNLDLKLRGKGVAKGKGMVELRGVPRFHTDGEVPELSPMRLYANDMPVSPDEIRRTSGVLIGTTLNWWQYVRSVRAMDNLQRSIGGELSTLINPVDTYSNVLHNSSTSPRVRVQKGKDYEVSIKGPMNEASADVRFAEAQDPKRMKKGGGRGKKGKKKRSSFRST